MHFFCLAVFIIISVVHLQACHSEKDSIRTHTKLFLIPFLLIYYLVSCSCFSIPFNKILFFALFTSWVGDVMLVRTKFYFLIIGGISFLIAHLCFIPIYYANTQWELVSYPVLIIAAIIYAGCAFAVFYVLNKALPQPFFYGVLIYLLVNGTMNIFALAFALSNRNICGILVYLGSVFFFFSDIVLFLVRFHQKNTIFKGHFVIMLTYILAEFLITQGIFLLQFFER